LRKPNLDKYYKQKKEWKETGFYTVDITKYNIKIISKKRKFNEISGDPLENKK